MRAAGLLESDMDARVGAETESLQARPWCHEAAAGVAFLTVLCLETWSFIRWNPGWWGAVLMVIAGWICGAVVYAFIAPPSLLPLRLWYERVPGFVVLWMALGLGLWALSGQHQAWWYAVSISTVVAIWGCAKAIQAPPDARRSDRSQSSEPASLKAMSARGDSLVVRGTRVRQR